MAAKLNRLILQLRAEKGGRPLGFRRLATSTIGEAIDEGVISSLEGEMSGRTEGGAPADDLEMQPLRRRRAANG